MFLEFNLNIGTKEQYEIKVPFYKKQLFLPYSIGFSHIDHNINSFDIKGICGNTTLFDFNSTYFMCETYINLNNVPTGTNDFIVRIKNGSNKPLLTNLQVNYHKLQTVPLVLTKTLVPNEFSNLSFLENYSFLDKLLLIIPYHIDYQQLELCIRPNYNLNLYNTNDHLEFEQTSQILGSKTVENHTITFCFNLRNYNQSDFQYLTLQNTTLIKLPSDLKIHSFVYGLI